MIIELVAASVFWFHTLPHHGGISTTMSPRDIITGMTLEYNHHCKHQYGDYVQTHEQHDNTISLRKIGSIALRPTGNEQGGHYCMSLKTGRRLNRNNVTPLPMPSEVIEHVHRIAHCAPVGLTSADRNNVAFPDIKKMMKKSLMYPILTPNIVTMMMIPPRQQTLKILSRSQEWTSKNLNLREWRHKNLYLKEWVVNRKNQRPQEWLSQLEQLHLVKTQIKSWMHPYMNLQSLQHCQILLPLYLHNKKADA